MPLKKEHVTVIINDANTRMMKIYADLSKDKIAITIRVWITYTDSLIQLIYEGNSLSDAIDAFNKE